MPIAPALPGQLKPQTSFISSRLNEPATSVLDLSPAKRPLLQAFITDPDDKHRLSLPAKYQVMLVPRHLDRGRSSITVTPLTDAEEHQYLSASETINFNEPAFQHWLDINGLRRKKESDLQFAWHAFLTIRKVFSYRYSEQQDRHIAMLCQERSTDCGGLSWLFSGTLRANGVPARSLIGRMAVSDSEPGIKVGAAHVKAEFYAKGVGWIPVEISGAASNKGADPLQYFGADDGDLVAFHVDPDFVLDTKLFGKQSIGILQRPAFWVAGPGHLKDISVTSSWTVKEIPAY